LLSPVRGAHFDRKRLIGYVSILKEFGVDSKHERTTEEELVRMFYIRERARTSRLAFLTEFKVEIIANGRASMLVHSVHLIRGVLHAPAPSHEGIKDLQGDGQHPGDPDLARSLQDWEHGPISWCRRGGRTAAGRADGNL